MTAIESSDPDEAFIRALAAARERLEPPVRVQRVWPAAVAAAFFAFAAVVFAAAAVLAPPQPSAPMAGVRGPL